MRLLVTRYFTRLVFNLSPKLYAVHLKNYHAASRPPMVPAISIATNFRRHLRPKGNAIGRSSYRYGCPNKVCNIEHLCWHELCQPNRSPSTLAPGGSNANQSPASG